MAGGGRVIWSGGDLLSRVLRRSTIGATGLNGRVRNGIGCFPRAVTTRPSRRRRACAGRVGCRTGGRDGITGGPGAGLVLSEHRPVLGKGWARLAGFASRLFWIGSSLSSD